MNEHDEALRKQTAFLGQPKGVGTRALCSFVTLLQTMR